MSKLLDVAIFGLQVSIVTAILIIIALFAVDAWIAEDDARSSKLQKHLYAVALERDNWTQLPEQFEVNGWVVVGQSGKWENPTPNVRHYQDASVKGAK